MNKIIKKTIVWCIGICLTIIVCFYLYAFIFTLGLGYWGDSRTYIDYSKEFIDLQEKIKKEIKGDVIFESISKKELKECNIVFDIYLWIKNDSITHSKTAVDNYIIELSKRVSEKLEHKECIDSLKIKVNTYYSKEKGSLRNNDYIYSFPVR